ncbi:MAG: hypothetical protein JWO67_148 [Streptosporangiaceae bacterium]|nr:hypothetical protein [Streptosporangiaceae bacterium]
MGPEINCIGASAICTHDEQHPCRDCHVRALAVIAALEASGRLLPSGGEVSEEYSVVFEDGYRAKTFDERLAQIWRADPQAAIVGPVQRRTVTIWPDGSNLLGPWSPVLSDNSEVPNAD